MIVLYKYHNLIKSWFSYKKESLEKHWKNFNKFYYYNKHCIKFALSYNTVWLVIVERE